MFTKIRYRFMTEKQLVREMQCIGEKLGSLNSFEEKKPLYDKSFLLIKEYIRRTNDKTVLNDIKNCAEELIKKYS